MQFRAWTGARADLVLAVALAIAALTQAAVSPIASVPVAVVIALLTTAPVAVRRTHPILAALLTTAAGLIPSNGYVYVGYVVAFIVFYSVAVYVPQWRRVAAWSRSALSWQCWVRRSTERCLATTSGR